MPPKPQGRTKGSLSSASGPGVGCGPHRRGQDLNHMSQETEETDRHTHTVCQRDLSNTQRASRTKSPPPQPGIQGPDISVSLPPSLVRPKSAFPIFFPSLPPTIPHQNASPSPGTWYGASEEAAHRAHTASRSFPRAPCIRGCLPPPPTPPGQGPAQTISSPARPAGPG